MASTAGRIDEDNSPMSVSSTVAGVLIGLVVGFPAGMLFAIARRGWTDLTGAKKAVPTARKVAFTRTREAVILGALLAVVGAVAIGIARGK
jgi:hypothetical protein